MILGVRPEAFEDAGLADPGLPTIDADVLVLEELGSDTHVVFPIDAPRVEAEDLRAAADDEEELLIEDRALWNARVGVKSSARAGGRLKLAVDPAALYFFDPESGTSLTASARATVPA